MVLFYFVHIIRFSSSNITTISSSIRIALTNTATIGSTATYSTARFTFLFISHLIHHTNIYKFYVERRKSFCQLSNSILHEISFKTKNDQHFTEDDFFFDSAQQPQQQAAQPPQHPSQIMKEQSQQPMVSSNFYF